MPFCPRCNADHRDGFTRCSDFDVRLVTSLPAARQNELHWTPMHREPERDPSTVAEAEAGYEVRACPACAFYFNQTFSACPGCGVALVPAVEVFNEGQAEPDRVIVGVGSGSAVRALRDRLNDGGFAAEAFHVEGWLIAAADLPWRELTRRTAEAETIVGLRSAAG